MNLRPTLNGIVHPLGCKCATCTSLPMIYASQPREITPEMQQMAKDAERYRWLKTNAVHVTIATEKDTFSLNGKNLDDVIDMASETA